MSSVESSQKAPSVDYCDSSGVPSSQWTILSGRPSVPSILPPQLDGNDDDDWSSNSEGDDAAASSWQEEAHWMSFQHAVQSFVQQRNNNNNNSSRAKGRGTNNNQLERTDEEALDDSLMLSFETTPTVEGPVVPSAKERTETALWQAQQDELEFHRMQQQQKQGTTK